jgi:type I restriction enzyme S subunit
LRNIDQGAAQPNLNTDLIKDTFIPLCSQPEQLAVTGELEAKLSEVDQLDQTISASLQQAEALRQSILKRAFSGQLVPQDPKDEPASVLLARIKAEKSAQPKGRKART